mgnify:CR=1 FL=1
MARDLGSARVGDIVTASVVEVVSPHEMIVNIQGHLLRVVDKTMRINPSTPQIDLVVVQVKPLAFKLATAHKNGRISITV